MRVIAGSAKKRRLFTRTGTCIRYSADKVKGAIFNILGEQVLRARVLDLYAGSGSLGLEAISRGAQTVTFVEKTFGAGQLIKRNIELLGWQKRCEVIRGNVPTIVQRLLQHGKQYDLILADPPYQENKCRQLLTWLNANPLVRTNGIIVCEHHKKEQLPGEFENLKFLRQRTFGDTTISFYLYQPVVVTSRRDGFSEL